MCDVLDGKEERISAHDFHSLSGNIAFFEAVMFHPILIICSLYLIFGQKINGKKSRLRRPSKKYQMRD